MSFETRVVECQAKRLVGIKVQTNMENSTKDCSALWPLFAPYMAKINKDPKESFGVSVMLNENDFDYWAALEVIPGVSLPDALQCVDILLGTYVCCTVPSIEKLGEVYMYLYMDWLKSQTGYVLNHGASSFERYPCPWQPDTPFEIYMPIKKL